MKKFALAGLAILVIGVLGTIFNWNQLIGRSRMDTVERSIEVENKEIDAIDIKSDLAEVYFFPTDEETIQIDVRGKSNKSIDELLEVKESGDRLLITIDHHSRFPKVNIFPFWNHQNLTVSVGIPESFNGSVEARVDVGKIRINDLKFAKFTGVINVGDLEGRNFETSEGSVEVDVGDIDLIDVVGDWYLSADVGQIDLDLVEWQGNVEAYVDIGNIKIHIPEEPEFYSLRLEAELGDVKGVDDPIIEFRSADSRAIPRLDASTDIGNITLNWGR